MKYDILHDLCNRVSVVQQLVSACHAEDLGSIPSRDVILVSTL